MKRLMLLFTAFVLSFYMNGQDCNVTLSITQKNIVTRFCNGDEGSVTVTITDHNPGPYMFNVYVDSVIKIRVVWPSNNNTVMHLITCLSAGEHIVEIEANGCLFIDTVIIQDSSFVLPIDTLVEFPDTVTVSDKNPMELQAKLYPNPTYNQLFIELPQDDDWTIELWTITGQKLESFTMQGTRHELHLGMFSEGMYIVRFSSKKREIYGQGRVMVLKS